MENESINAKKTSPKAVKRTININMAKSLPKLIQRNNMNIPSEKLLDQREALHEIVKSNHPCFLFRTNRDKEKSVQRMNDSSRQKLVLPSAGGRASS